jgi:hypothetical protein
MSCNEGGDPESVLFMKEKNEIQSKNSSKEVKHTMTHKTFIFLVTTVIVLAFSLSGAMGKDKGTRNTTNVKPAEPQQPSAQSPSAEPVAGEQINWQVISSGGHVRDASDSYRLGGTVGQTAVGTGNTPPTCCNTDGIRGDCDMNGSLNVADVTCLVGPLKNIIPPPFLCEEEADINGSGTINVVDVTYLVSYLKQKPPGSPPPPPCGYRLYHGFWQSF